MEAVSEYRYTGQLLHPNTVSFPTYDEYNIPVVQVDKAVYEGVGFSALGIMRVLDLPKNTLQKWDNKETQEGTPAVFWLGKKAYFSAVFAMYLSYKAGHVQLFRWLDQITIDGMWTMESNDIAYWICAKLNIPRAIPRWIRWGAEEESEILTDLFIDK